MPTPLKTKKARLERERKARKQAKQKARRARNLRHLRGAHVNRETHVLVHTWVTEPAASISGVCPDCDDMDGVQIMDGDSFDVDTVEGDPWPPVHPNCNCEILSEWVPR